MGHAPGGSSRAGAFSCLVTRIVPDDSEITALRCYNYIVNIDSCSIVGPRVDKGGAKSEQEAGQRRRVHNETQGRSVVGSLLRAHARGPEAEGRLRQDARGGGREVAQGDVRS